MGRIGVAFRSWWKVLTDADAAARVDAVLGDASVARIAEPQAAPATEPATEPTPEQNPALTLLAALQRDARFVDFLKEPLDEYDDAQIGAVARDMHREARVVIDRFFALEPVARAEEGSDIDLPESFDPGQYRLTGNVSGGQAARGTLQHHGWQASRCELPSWTGTTAAASVVAPAEVEVK